jgi:hypothetical protein
MRERFQERLMTGSINIDLGTRGKWSADKGSLINQIDSTVREFVSMGYRLTLRQLYYQLVAKDAIPNHDKVYKKLSSILDDCRYSGLIDWNAIEDRGRVPFIPYSVDDVADAIKDTIEQYRLDRQKGQPTLIELWTEKDAISGILKVVTSEFHVRLIVNKGYISSSAIYTAYNRFIQAFQNGQKVVINYFGDHDPSGLDMVRDIRERLTFMFSHGRKINNEQINTWLDNEGLSEEDAVQGFLPDSFSYADDDSENQRLWNIALREAFVEEHFKVNHCGLTTAQVKQYNPPPNPAKITDPRAKEYIKKHGNVSWEVDALRPEIMAGIVTDAITQSLDKKIYDSVIKQEETDIKKLKKFLNQESK